MIDERSTLGYVTEPDRRDRLRAAGLWLMRQRGARTQKEIANAIGKTSANVSNYERGMVGVPVEVVPALARVLNISEHEVRQGLGMFTGEMPDNVLFLPPDLQLTEEERERATQILRAAFAPAPAKVIALPTRATSKEPRQRPASAAARRRPKSSGEIGGTAADTP